MSASYLIDTNILVHAIRQKKGRWEFLERLVQAGGSLACSVLTVGELYAGMKAPEKARTEELLEGFERHEVTEEIARYAGLLKNEWAARGFTFTLVDMIIAATAIAHKLTLVTENRKDFPMPELTLHDLLGGA
jgi:predicted nucleic acid-binding protein